LLKDSLCASLREFASDLARSTNEVLRECRWKAHSVPEPALFALMDARTQVSMLHDQRRKSGRT
jgi:hypothetical protein